MQVASIVPIHYLPLIKGKPYHLCLAHLALNYSDYRNFYKEEAQNGSYVILDNGAAEGETVEVQELLQLAIYLGAFEVILPDFIGDYEKTITESYRALHYIKSREDYKGKVMAVPQASSFKSWLTAAEEMLTWPIDTLGIPKFLTYAFGPCARLLALHRLRSSLSFLRAQGKIQIHLLGCAYDPREVGTIKELSPISVRGVDSSLPYLLARDGHYLLHAYRHHIQRSQEPVDFLDKETDPGFVAANIQVWEDICAGELV